MKIRTSIRAGGSGCSPETQSYMQKAQNLQDKVENCVSQRAYAPVQPPYSGYVPTSPTSPSYPSYTGSTTYPDMSGVCG
jgi:hypothetical protein